VTFWAFMNEHWFVGPATLLGLALLFVTMVVDVSTNLRGAYAARVLAKAAAKATESPREESK